MVQDQPGQKASETSISINKPDMLVHISNPRYWKENCSLKLALGKKLETVSEK
jgi:hypothetical protein